MGMNLKTKIMIGGPMKRLIFISILMLGVFWGLFADNSEYTYIVPGMYADVQQLSVEQIEEQGAARERWLAERSRKSEKHEQHKMISQQTQIEIDGLQAVNITPITASLNSKTDSLGDYIFLGTCKNTGSIPAVFVKVNIILYDSGDNVIGTDYTYVYGGTCTKLSASGIYTNALYQNDIGYFRVWTNYSYSQVARITYYFVSSTYSCTKANAAVSITSGPYKSNYLGYLKLTGNATNSSSNYLTYFTKVWFCIFNSSSKVEDVSFTYIDGSSYDYGSGTTDTALQPGETGSFSDYFVFCTYSAGQSYLSSFEFDEVKVNNNTEKPTIALNKNSLTFNAGGGSSQTFTVSNSGAGTLNWTVTDNKSWMSASPTSGQNSGTVTVTVDRTGLSPGTYTGTITVSDPNATNDPQTISVTLEVSGGSGGTPTIQLNRSNLYFGASGSYVTGSQTITIANSGTGTLNWSASANYTSWLSLSPSSGTNSGVVSAVASNPGLSPGTYNGTISIQDPNASNSPQTVNVTLTVYKAGTTSEPFGDFATPVHGAVVRSSIPVTGWVVDDIEVVSIKIYNGSNYVGDGVFVEGPRPDVEQAYPTYPKSYQAGWGYMMLTNFLPNGGNGTYTIYAKATDAEGHTVTLGSKTITCDNANAVKPFGAIDTPGQGGIASGDRFVNWGWALTPQPNSIPTNGSTINVYVDGVNLGHPTYNNYRADIATLFPGYANSNGAAGYFYLDTTGYENGVHTIQWTATDSGGNTDGIGSRYFTIQNTGSSTSQSQNTRQNVHFTGDINLSRLPVDHYEHVRIKTGYDKFRKTQDIYPDDNGYLNIQVKELDRVEIHFSIPTANISLLPVGSSLDAQRGIFYWGLGPGFLGNYEFVFVDSRGFLRKVNITVTPKY
jgi:hypothetical protein